MIRTLVVAAMLGPVAALLGGPALALPADPLASMVGDRLAGAPVDCIETAEIDQVRIAAGVGLVYEMKTGRVMYLNRPTAGLGFLHDGVVPASERAGAQLCSVEQVRLLNENSRRPIASLTLGRFVPYRRPLRP